MDRFVVREPRVGADFPQANQIIRYSSNNLPGNNNTMIPPESMYLGGYGREYPMQHNIGPSGYYPMHHQMGSPANFQMQSPNSHQSSVHHQQFHPGQGQMSSGIDPRYLAAYSDSNASTFIASGQQMQVERTQMAPHSFGGDYENRSFVAVDRSKPKQFVAKVTTPQIHKEKSKEQPMVMTLNNSMGPRATSSSKEQLGFLQWQTPQHGANKNLDDSAIKAESSVKTLTRADKIKALQKAGPRAFSGPVEKVLKWHKALQEIGILIMYEIVAKCVSVRAGDSCAKNLVVRDDSGPAMQVVYYEVDFLLPELKPPCTIRVIGRMMPGTCRLQAFSVRPATGDDVAALPRRAAVAAHHVAKICKEYGISV